MSNMFSIHHQVSIHKHNCYLYWVYYHLPNEYAPGSYKNKYSHVTMNLQTWSVSGDRICQHLSVL